jgi:hypothetical protein
MKSIVLVVTEISSDLGDVQDAVLRAIAEPEKRT